MLREFYLTKLIHLLPRRFFVSHDREFHVASLPYKPDFRVIPEGWDGTTQDPDAVLYEISMKEDEMLYQEFVQKMNFNKMKPAKKMKYHKYSRRNPSEGWKINGGEARFKRGNGGGWKFISQADGSSRPLNDDRENVREKGDSSEAPEDRDKYNWPLVVLV